MESASIFDTEPDARWNYIVNDVLRDKKSGWMHNYFADYNRTSWDVGVALSRSGIAEATETIESNTKLVTTIEETIAKSRLLPTDANFKAISKKEKAELDRQYAAAMDLINENRRTLHMLIDRLDEQTWQQYVEMQSSRNLRILRNRFQLDGNIDYLKRGITWTLKRQYALLGKAFVDEEPSISAW